MLFDIFVVNLKTSTNRKKYMQALCTKHGLSPIFIEAVYGKDLSLTEITSVCDKHRTIRTIGRELMPGEIGCALSHRKIYKKIVDENIKVALVLEDDAMFEPLLGKVLSSIELFPETWDLVLLGHHGGGSYNESPSICSFWGNVKLSKRIALKRLSGKGFGTYGYLINQKGASKLLKELETIYRPIDHYTSDDTLVNVYAVSPTVVKVKQAFETLIDESSLRTLYELSPLKKVLSSLRLLTLAKQLNKFRKKIKPLKKYI